MNKIGVILNTLPLLEKKTGIGYCVYNLLHRLQKYEEIDLYPAHNLKPGFFTLNKILKSISTPLKKTVKKKYPVNLAATVYNTAVAPITILSTLKIKRILTKVKIYHETRHVIIKELEPYIHKIKLISDIHDLSPLLYPQLHIKSHVDNVKKSWDKLMASDHFITKSNFIKTQMIDELGIDGKKISVIPNAPGSNYYRLPPKEKKKCRQKISSIIGDSDFLLYTGTIEPRKNLETLFDAIKIIKFNNKIGKKNKLKLILAGGMGWDYNKILEYPEKIGIKDRVKFLGYTPEDLILKLYNLCEAFVYPSWYEGFGMPPLEAMACGAVPVISDTSSLPEVVGNCGLLFNPHSPEELAFKIEDLLTNKELKIKLAEKGIERAKKYNWNNITRQTVKLYKEISLT